MSIPTFTGSKLLLFGDPLRGDARFGKFVPAEARRKIELTHVSGMVGYAE